MPFPHAVARFNKRVTNRFIEPIVRRFSSFAVVHHVGRRSGSSYTTPICVFEAEDEVIVALTYGPRTDWFQNTLAGPTTLEYSSGTRRITSATLVNREVAWPYLPSFVRVALRVLRVDDFARLTTEP